MKTALIIGVTGQDGSYTHRYCGYQYQLLRIQKLLTKISPLLMEPSTINHTEPTQRSSENPKTGSTEPLETRGE